MSRWSNSVLAAGVGAGFLILVWGAGIGGIDRALFDGIARLGLPDESGKDDVIAVRLPSGASPAACQEAVSGCLENGAVLVAVMAPAAWIGSSEFPALPDGVLVGRPAGAIGTTGDEGGIVVLPPMAEADGIVRTFVARWADRETLPAAIGRALGRAVPGDRRLCVFPGRAGGVPVIDAARLADGEGSLRSVLGGRVAVVGEVDPGGALVSTFRHRGPDALSPLLHQAVVAESVLDGDLAAPLSAGWGWGLALLASGIVLLAGWLFRGASVAVTGCLVAGGVVGAAWWGLHFGACWIGPAAPLTAVATTAVLAAGMRAASERSGMESVLRRLSAEAEQHASGKAFLVGDSPWPLVRSAVEGGFGIAPIVILVPGAGGAGLEPAQSDMGDIVREVFGGRSPRADDPPFRRAAERGGLCDAGGGWVVAALRGEVGVHGFVLLPGPGIDGRDIGSGFDGALDALAGLLDFRDRWRERARQGGRAPGGADRFRPLHERLSGSIGLLDASRSLLAECVSATREACLVIDVFGRILHRSSEAVRWCADLGIDLESTSPPALVAILSGRPQSECRRLWVGAVFHGEPACVAGDPALRPGRRFLLHLTPLPERSPGWRSGVVVQVEDITGIARATILKDELIERIHYQLNNDFESISGAADLLADGRIGADDQAVLMGTLRDKVAEAGRMLRSSRVHFHGDLIPEPVGAYPVHVDPLLEAAWAAVERDAAAAGIGIDRERHPFDRLVLAAPREFERIAAAALRILIRDARPGTRISIRSWQSRGGIVIALENTGFGVPASRLRAVVRAGADEDPELSLVARGRGLIGAWGGSLTTDAGVDEGIRFRIRLRNVL